MAGGSRRDLMLEVALDLFAQQGFDGTPISQIAHAVGVSKAAVSFHFVSKEDMLLELVDPLLTDLEAIFHPAADRSWPDGVWNITGSFLDTLVVHHPVAVWVDTDRGVHDRSPCGERLLSAQSALVDVIAGGSDVTADRIKAISAAGGIWRPLRVLTADEIRAHRQDILEAALSPYIELSPVGPGVGSAADPSRVGPST